MFIQVTDLNGNEVRVNTQQMVYYCRTTMDGTELKFRDGPSLHVRQSVEALDRTIGILQVAEEK